ncbi:MAG: hypothetical protein ACI9OJ_004478, partial [Myxococcota bacterium]
PFNASQCIAESSVGRRKTIPRDDLRALPPPSYGVA